MEAPRAKRGDRMENGSFLTARILAPLRKHVGGAGLAANRKQSQIGLEPAAPGRMSVLAPGSPSLLPSRTFLKKSPRK